MLQMGSSRACERSGSNRKPHTRFHGSPQFPTLHLSPGGCPSQPVKFWTNASSRQGAITKRFSKRPCEVYALIGFSGRRSRRRSLAQAAGPLRDRQGELVKEAIPGPQEASETNYT